MKKQVLSFRIRMLSILLIFQAGFVSMDMNSQPLFDSVVISAETIGKFEKFEINAGITTQVSNVYNYEKFCLIAVFTAQ